MPCFDPSNNWEGIYFSFIKKLYLQWWHSKHSSWLAWGWLQAVHSRISFLTSVLAPSRFFAPWWQTRRCGVQGLNSLPPLFVGEVLLMIRGVVPLSFVISMWGTLFFVNNQRKMHFYFVRVDLFCHWGGHKTQAGQHEEGFQSLLHADTPCDPTNEELNWAKQNWTRHSSRPSSMVPYQLAD